MDKKTIIIKCKICEKILDLDNPKIGTVLKDDSYYCIPCHEVIDFCDFLNEDKLIVKKDKPIVKKEEPKATTLFKCHKCKVEYSGKNCTNCNEINILFIRKKKKKKK